MAATQRLPRRGAAVLIFDYGAGTQFRPRPRRFAFAQFRFANYECFGPSYLVRFPVDGHNLQVNVAVGAAASSSVRAEALAILDSIR